ncbi:MAG: ACT domain-containing protein, partial [Balneolaceae bacterium]
EGREIWEKRAAKGKVEITDQELTKVAHKFQFESTQDMFFEIGSGAFDVNELFRVVKQLKSKGRLDNDNKNGEAESEEEIQEQYISTARSVGEDKALLVEGELSNVKYSYANCCNPIPGDNVIGFISRNGDVKIHRSNCKNAHHLIKTDSERIIDVSWARNIDTQFLGAVKLIGEDRVGLVNDLTEIVSKSLKTNMKSINVNSEGGMFEGILTIYVNDLKHLEKVIQRLERVEGIKNVTRYE